MSGLIFKLIFLLFLIILFTQTIKTFLISDLEGNSNKRLNIDNETNLKVDRVRDMFIIGCYTGLRFSDIINIL